MKSCAMSLTSPLVAMLNGLAIVYVPFLMLSTVASAPSMLTAFTVSSKEPRETYPIAYSSLATEVSITDVLFVMIASSVVLSTLFPSASFSSIPNNSMNAPLVPEPSSRDNTFTYSLASKSAVAAGVSSAVVSAASVEASAVVSAAVLVSAVLSEPHPAIMLTANIPVTNKLITFFFIMIFLQISMGYYISHLCFFVSVSLTMTTLKAACKI